MITKSKVWGIIREGLRHKRLADKTAEEIMKPAEEIMKLIKDVPQDENKKSKT
mgnify:FL=1